jgi:hypothetical protein
MMKSFSQRNIFADQNHAQLFGNHGNVVVNKVGSNSHLFCTCNLTLTSAWGKKM